VWHLTKKQPGLPREKFFEKGPASLSDYELVAILLRTGTKGTNVLELSKKILEKYGSLTHLLTAECSELAEVKGLGIAKAVSLKAALEIGNRVFKELVTRTDLPLKEPKSVYYLCNDMSFLDKEVVRVISLNNKLNYSGMDTISVGIVDASLLHPREVYRPAIKKSASAIILVHNHPSGIPDPSTEDVEITKRLSDSGEMLGIKMVDHVIIGKGKCYSFAAGKQYIVPEVKKGDFEREGI